MTGREYRAIRSFNKIKMIEIRKVFNYKTDSPLQGIEKSNEVPTVYVNWLSKKLGKDLDKPEIVFDLMSKIPQKFKEPRARSTNIYKGWYNE